jgi:hypothetical protein
MDGLLGLKIVNQQAAAKSVADVSHPFDADIQSKGLPRRAVKVRRLAGAKDPVSATSGLIHPHVRIRKLYIFKP